jgi:peptide deformylase
LSIPEYYDEVERAAEVEITFQDRNGQLKNLKADGLLAIAIQHEMDHLGGHLFVERLPMLKRKKFEKEWKKRARENKRF